MNKSDREALYKQLMGSYPTGVTVITTNNEKGVPVGLTVNSFASVSLDPMLILWSIDRGASSLEDFKLSKGFAVHILAADQKQLCIDFSTKGADRFGKNEWELSELNLPVLKDVYGVLQCETHRQIEAGDHIIMIGAVKDIQLFADKEPMLYFRRQLGAVPEGFYVNS